MSEESWHRERNETVPKMSVLVRSILIMEPLELHLIPLKVHKVLIVVHDSNPGVEFVIPRESFKSRIIRNSSCGEIPSPLHLLNEMQKTRIDTRMK